MFKKFIPFIIFGAIVASCGGEKTDVKTPGKKDTIDKIMLNANSKESILQKIAAAEKKSSQTGNVMDKNVAQGLISAYNEYVMYYPQDTLSKKFAFLSATVAINSFNNQQAIVLIDNFINGYPDKEKRLQFLVLKAMVLDDRIQDKAKAKEVYEQIIREYPGSPAADQAKDAMKNLGKSDIELIREMEKKNGVVK